jgi:subtilisin family serine protease
MNEFPASMLHGNGLPMTLDPTRLVLAFGEQQSWPDLEPLLDGSNLVLETNDDPWPFPEGTGPGPAQRVAHSGRVYWVRDADGIAIEQARFENVRDALAALLDWIGPVYRVDDEPGQEGLLCPLPHVLVVEPAAGLDMAGEAQLIALLQSFDLFEQPLVTAQLNGQRYCMRPLSNSSPVYGIRDTLLEQAAGLIDNVTLEHAPMLIALSGDTNDPMDKGWLSASHVTEAWDLLGPTDTPVVVGIVDSGVDLTHPDLRLLNAGVYLNHPSRFATILPTGRPTLRPDSNGIPRPETHGTVIAGIIGMIHNNRIGGAGVARNALIFSAAHDLSSDIMMTRGINECVRNGARVINMSWGYKVQPNGVRIPFWPSRAALNVDTVNPALEAAHDAGVVLCAGSGNNGSLTFISWPASHPRVIACGYWDNWLEMRDPSSNASPELSVVTSSTGVRSTTIQGRGNDDDPDYMSDNLGATSWSCAVLSGICALLLNKYPLLSADQVRAIIERTARKVSGGPLGGGGTYTEERPHGRWDSQLGFGLVDAFRALDFADVWIRHHGADNGVEPTPAPFIVTANSDIVLSSVDFASPATAFAGARAAEVVAGITNHVYVRVFNDGPAPARNVVVSVRVVPQTRLPFTLADWRAVDLDHVLLPVDPSTNMVSELAAGASAVFKFTMFPQSPICCRREASRASASLCLPR